MKPTNRRIVTFIGKTIRDMGKDSNTATIFSDAIDAVYQAY